MGPLTHGGNINLLPAADLTGEIETLKEDLREERDRHVRTLADFKNYRRRAERDGAKIAEEGKREVLQAMLGIVDDLDNALVWTSRGEQALVKGVPIIRQKLVAVLEAHGVRTFESAGTAFTPDLHEAAAVTQRNNVEPGTVVEVIRRGYLWKDELLRPAQVQAAQ